MNQFEYDISSLQKTINDLESNNNALQHENAQLKSMLEDHGNKIFLKYT